jgi:D-3-phosphoglycerate dehydrogenase / 2-oxoglutarate reductase
MAEVVVFESVWGEPLANLPFDVERRSGTTAAEVSDREPVRAVVVRNRTQVDEAFLGTFPQLAIVGRAGVGLDNIDVLAADARGVVVVSPRGANAVSVAEHALGLALAVARRIAHLDADVRAGGWNRTPGTELSAGTWGLLGAGATGLACARLARALGMRVVAYDPYVPAASLKADGIEAVSLEEAADQATVLSCHLPATPETSGLLGQEFFATNRSGLILVNVGRGEVVDEDALAEALSAGRLAGAGLDVRRQEPPAAGPLDPLPNVVLTPHVAGITAQSQHRILSAIAADIERVLGGKPAEFNVGAVNGAA